jgi:creatinine amidohydrolase
VAEWSNAAVSKAVVLLVGTQGSNPCLTALFRNPRLHVDRAHPPIQKCLNHCVDTAKPTWIQRHAGRFSGAGMGGSNLHEGCMYLLSDMSWEEVKEYLEHDDRVIIALGSMEEHGRHLGLGTDLREGEAIAVGTGEVSGVAVAPTLNYGMALTQMGFPGTLSLRPATLMAVIEDLLRAFYHHGFRRIFVVNGHGGNTASFYDALQTVAVDLPDLRVKHFAWWTDAEAYGVVKEMTGEQHGSHAGAAETSFMQAIRPGAVKLERLTGKDAPIQPSREVTTIHNFRQLYPDGIMGYHPTKASPEAGLALLNKSVEICSHELENWDE